MYMLHKTLQFIFYLNKNPPVYTRGKKFGAAGLPTPHGAAPYGCSPRGRNRASNGTIPWAWLGSALEKI